MAGGGLYTELITRKYQATGQTTIAGRTEGSQIGTSADPDADFDVTYAYDALGGLEKITGTDLPAGGVA